MYCNKCKFFKKDTSKLFDGISISCSKYKYHFGFATKVKKIRTPNWCKEVKNDE